MADRLRFSAASRPAPPPAVGVAQCPSQFAVPANHAVAQGNPDAAADRVDDRAVSVRPVAGPRPTLVRPIWRVRSPVAAGSPASKNSRAPVAVERDAASPMKWVHSPSGRSSGRRSTESERRSPGSGSTTAWCSFFRSREGFRPAPPEISERSTTVVETLRRGQFPRSGRRSPSPAAFRAPNGGAPRCRSRTRAAARFRLDGRPR